MSEHTVKAFDADLHELTRQITEMGELVVKQIGDAVSALANHDLELARRIIAADADVDRLQREIEEKAVLTIARRQPMAVDLREIVGSLRVANGLERVGDYAKNISKRVIKTGVQIGPAAAVRGLQHMADLVVTAVMAVAAQKGDRTLMVPSAHNVAIRVHPTKNEVLFIIALPGGAEMAFQTDRETPFKFPSLCAIA